MSEEEKIDEQPIDDSSQSRENEKVSEENIQHPTLNIQHNEEVMEVHKHPHHVTHKKKWGEYLLEFFMLFLAVFLGFVAENFREHSVEQTREKEYVRSMIEDLKTDSAFLQETITKRIPYHIAWMDSLEFLLKEPVAKKNDRLVYQAFILATAWTYNFHPTERTLTQLRSAGFYLIRNGEAAKAITDLESITKISAAVEAEIEDMQQDIDMSAYTFADRVITKKLNDVAFKNFPVLKLEVTDIPESALINRDNKEAVALYIANLKKYEYYLGTGVQSNYEWQLKSITAAIQNLKEAYHLK